MAMHDRDRMTIDPRGGTGGSGRAGWMGGRRLEGGGGGVAVRERGGRGVTGVGDWCVGLASGMVVRE